MQYFHFREISSIVTAFAGAWLVTFEVRHWAPRWGMVAKPRADRWHARPTPLLGGIGIYCGFVAGWLILRPHFPGALALLLSATLLFAVGLADDIWTLKPYSKLTLQMLAAIVLIFSHQILPWTPFRLLNDLLTVFWLIGVTNAINLLDNMDGLASGIALLACGFQALFFLQNHQTALAMLTLVLACAIAAFLVFNFPPASIFMGDCGSLFLGFMLASLTLFSNWQRSRGLAAVLIVPVLIMLVPIVDTSLVTLSRIFHGRAITQGGRDHSSHRLVALGLNERSAVLLLMGLAGLSGSLALLLHYMREEVLYFLIPCFAVLVLFFAIRLGMVRVYSGQAPINAPFAFLMEFTYRKRILEVLLDLVLMALAYFGAFLLRFGAHLPASQLRLFDHYIPLLLSCELLVFLLLGMYSNLWRQICIEDVPLIIRCVAGGTLLFGASMLLLQTRPRLSLAVVILNGILLLLLAGGSRAALRLYSIWLRRHADRKAAIPVLIYGAGQGGELMLRELENRRHYFPVGFLDDDVRKTGRRLRGLPIYHPRELHRIVSEYAVQEILISSAAIADDCLEYPGLRLRRAGPVWTL